VCEGEKAELSGRKGLVYMKEDIKYSYPPNYDHRDEPALWQNPWEYNRLLDLLYTKHIKNILEIGVGYGLSKEVMNRSGITWVGIDITIPTLIPPEYMILGASYEERVIKRAESRGPYDVVLIDANHSYNSVSIDFFNYNHMATRMIVLHDISTNQSPPFRTDKGVKKFWNEIKGKYNHLEIVAREPENYGIGVIFK